MPNYLIYHPARAISSIANHVVYHDGFGPGNSDPYVWNDRFLHSFCHISQMRLTQVADGDINFWISGDTFPAFTGLWCDLVFVVGPDGKVQWEDRSNARSSPGLVDSKRAFNEHYNPGSKDHPLTGRKYRYTLKADPDRSFQPQNKQHALLDIVPILGTLGVSLDDLRKGLRAGFAAKPMLISNEVAAGLYKHLSKAARCLRGSEISKLYDICKGEGIEVRSRCGCAPASHC